MEYVYVIVKRRGFEVCNVCHGYGREEYDGYCEHCNGTGMTCNGKQRYDIHTYPVGTVHDTEDGMTLYYQQAFHSRDVAMSFYWGLLWGCHDTITKFKNNSSCTLQKCE